MGEEKLCPLQQYAVIRGAYGKVNFRYLFKEIYSCKNYEGSKRCCWGLRIYSIFGFIIISFFMLYSRVDTVHNFIDRKLFHIPSWIDISIWFVIIVIYYFIVNKCFEERFKKFYDNKYYQELIKIYHKDRQFFRYLIFKDKFLKPEISIIKLDFEKLKTIIDEDMKTNQITVSIFQFIFKHPLINFILSSIFFIGEQYIQKYVQQLSIQQLNNILAVLISIFLFFLFCFALVIIVLDIFGYKLNMFKKIKLKELKQFILWLENDKLENGQENSNSNNPKT